MGREGGKPLGLRDGTGLHHLFLGGTGQDGIRFPVGSRSGDPSGRVGESVGHIVGK